MRLYVNTDRQRLVAGLNNPSDLPLGLVEVKRGDNPSFDHVFCRDFGDAYEIDATVAFSDFRLTAKAIGDLGNPNFIISALAATKTGTGLSAVYSCSPSLNTVTLNDLYILGGVKATPADTTARLALTGLLLNDTVRQVDTQDYWMLTVPAAPSNPASWTLDELRIAAGYVDLAAETEWVQSGLQTSTMNFTLRVWDDVSKGNEGVPGAGTPAYPAPGLIDTFSAEQADLAVSAAAAAQLFADTQFGTLHTNILAAAGAGVFTAAYGLPTAAMKTGAQLILNVELPASANPTVEIRNATSAGTLLATITSPEPTLTTFWFGLFRFNGTAWKKIFSAFQ